MLNQHLYLQSAEEEKCHFGEQDTSWYGPSSPTNSISPKFTVVWLSSCLALFTMRWLQQAMGGLGENLVRLEHSERAPNLKPGLCHEYS